MKLDELEKLLSEATPGPWEIWRQTITKLSTNTDRELVCTLRNNAEKLIAVVRAASNPDLFLDGEYGPESYFDDQTNAEDALRKALKDLEVE